MSSFIYTSEFSYLDKIEEGVYQSWSGNAEYFKESSLKFSTEINIVNKHPKTYRQNKLWMDIADDASVQYRNSLIRSINIMMNNTASPNINSCYPNFILKNIGSLYGFIPQNTNGPDSLDLETGLAGWFECRFISGRITQMNMKCVKYDWNGSIEITINIKVEDANIDIRSLINKTFIELEIKWKKILVN